MKWLITYLLFVCNTQLLNAQLASYAFNSNVVDQIGGYDATTFGAPTFVNDEYMSLDEVDYLLLPIPLSSAIDISSSFEINVRFKVEGDHEATEGDDVRIILSSKEEYDQRVGGFDVTARQWEGDLRIVTTYGDGIYYTPGECPSCCATCEWSEGKLDFVSEIQPGTWYDFKIKFFLDKEVPYIQYEVNNAVSVSYFDDRVDFEGFRQTLDKQQIWVGSDEDNKILERDWHPNMQLDIDYLTFSSPIPPGDQTIVGNALQMLTDDINGSISLTEIEIDSLYNLFVQNWDDNSFGVNKATILTYMDAYAENHDYIFNEAFKERVEEFPPKEAIQYIIQQWIIDNRYGSSTVSEMEGVVFKDHEWFPGAVSNSAPRESGAIFIIDGSYQTDPGFKLNGQEYVRRPSGYYVPPGELVIITVPESAVGQGLTLYVGAHDANVQETWSEFSRFPRISTKYELNSSIITVANPFGGGIYITIPDGTQLGTLEFTVDGAIKAPYYSKKSGFENSLADFQADLANQYVPWIDMESSNFMCTISHGMASVMTDPDSVLSIWDKSFDAFNIALGRPLERFRSEYIIVDKQNHAKFTAAPASYPMSLETVARAYDQNLDLPIEVQEGRHWYREVLGAFHFIISHEYGHLHNMPTLNQEQEANVNMPAAAIYSLVMGESVDSAFVYSIQQRLNFEQAALDWILTPIFYKGYRMGLDTINYETYGDAIQMSYQSRGFAKLVDIAKMFGWEALGDIMGYFYEYKLANPEWDPYNLQDDEFIEAASKVMGFNMAPHFEFWGILPSDELVQGLDTMQTSDVIKERIIHYRRQVPEDNEAFLPIYQLMNRKIGPHHLVRYEAMKTNYDETIADSIIARIDTILHKYYEIKETDFNIDPVVTGLARPLSTFVDTPFTLKLLDLVVEDADNDYPDDFTLTIFNGENYSFEERTITPGQGFIGDLFVPVLVNDGLEDSELFSAKISVLPANEKPVITGLVTPLFTDQEIPIELSLTDFVVEDSDNTFPDDFTLRVYEGDNYSISGTTITPDPSFIGNLSVPVTVNDGLEDSEPYLAQVDVNAKNEVPVITGLVAPLVTDEGVSITISLTHLVVEDSDNAYPDDFTLTVLEGDNYSVSETTITPEMAFIGMLSVPVTVSDGTDQSEEYLVSIEVLSVLEIDDSFVKNHFTIYPNPTSDYLSIVKNQLVPNYEFKLFTATGNLIYFSNVLSDSNKLIDLRRMARGLYILKIKSPGGIGHFMVVKP